MLVHGAKGDGQMAESNSTPRLHISPSEPLYCNRTTALNNVHLSLWSEGKKGGDCEGNPSASAGGGLSIR